MLESGWDHHLTTGTSRDRIHQRLQHQQAMWLYTQHEQILIFQTTMTRRSQLLLKDARELALKKKASSASHLITTSRATIATFQRQREEKEAFQWEVAQHTHTMSEQEHPIEHQKLPSLNQREPPSVGGTPEELLEVTSRNARLLACKRRASTADHLTSPPTVNGVISRSSHSKTQESEEHTTPTSSIMRETIPTQPIHNLKAKRAIKCRPELPQLKLYIWTLEDVNRLV